MALTRQQSLSTYGTEKYTAWGETEAAADWKAKGSSTPTASGGTSDRFIGAIDPSQIPNMEAYAKSQFLSEDITLRDLILQMRGREKPGDIFERLEEKAELPALRKVRGSLMGQVQELEDVLKNIEPTTRAGVLQSLATESQVQGTIQARARAPREQLGEISTALSRIGGQISESERLVAQKVGYEILGAGYDLEIPQLLYATQVDRNARILSSFSQDRETKLTMLFDKLERTRFLEDSEWDLANTLASEERNYLKTLQTAAADAGVSDIEGKTPEQLLALIGIARAKELAKKGSTSGASTADEVARLRADVTAGASFKDTVQRYGSELSTSQIRAEYNAASRYGPATESEEEVRQWALKPEAEDTSAMRNVIVGMKAANEPLEEIHKYIYAKGKNPSDFNDILAEYEPAGKFPWSNWFK